jgi:hypothetical protein
MSEVALRAVGGGRGRALRPADPLLEAIEHEPNRRIALGRWPARSLSATSGVLTPPTPERA